MSNEAKLDVLDSKLDTLILDVNKVKSAVYGNGNRGLRTEIELVKARARDLAALEARVTELEAARNKLIGVFAGVGLASGGIGAVIANLLS